MTVGEIVTRALQLAGVVGPNRTPSAFEMADGIDTLNEMLSAWALDGMDLGLSTLVQGDENLIDPAFIKGIRYNLATELAGAHGILSELPQTVIIEAEAQKELIRASLCDIDYARCDKSLMPFSRFGFNWLTGQ